MYGLGNPAKLAKSGKGQRWKRRFDSGQAIDSPAWRKSVLRRPYELEPSMRGFVTVASSVVEISVFFAAAAALAVGLLGLR
jgi:hypothetical protein